MTLSNGLQSLTVVREVCDEQQIQVNLDLRFDGLRYTILALLIDLYRSVDSVLFDVHQRQNHLVLGVVVDVSVQVEEATSHNSVRGQRRRAQVQIVVQFAYDILDCRMDHQKWSLRK